MEAHPDIKVECEFGAWNGWTEKISTSLVAGAIAVEAMPKPDSRLAGKGSAEFLKNMMKEKKDERP